MSYERFLKTVLKHEQLNKTIDEYEEVAWQNLQNGTSESLYAIDNPISQFNNSCEFINLNQFSRAQSLIHQGDIQMEGIHTPYLYIGSHITYFGFHLEDSDLCSINYLHGGGAKLWYFVPTSENAKLEKLANEFGIAVATTCNNFIRHKSLMISPAILRKN